MSFILKFVLICVLLSQLCPNFFVNNKDIDYSAGLCATRPTSFQVFKSISVGDSLLLSVKLPNDPNYHLVRTKYYRSEHTGVKHEGQLFQQWEFTQFLDQIHTKSNWFSFEYESNEIANPSIPDSHFQIGSVFWSERNYTTSRFGILPRSTFPDPLKLLQRPYLVYNGTTDEAYDDTHFLNLKGIYLQFPDTYNKLEILNILIFENKVKGYLPSKEYNRYHCLVYTRESFQLKGAFRESHLYARHYLVGFVHKIRVSSDSDYELYFIDWKPNEEIDYCTYLAAPVSGVALVELANPDKQKSYSVRFVEFNHFTHRINEITLEQRRSAYYTIEEIKETKNPSKQNIFLLNCDERRPKYEVCWTNENIEVKLATGLGQWHLMMAKFPTSKTSAASCVRAHYFSPLNPITNYIEAQSCPEIEGYSDNAKKFWFSLVMINRYTTGLYRSYFLFMVEKNRTTTALKLAIDSVENQIISNRTDPFEVIPYDKPVFDGSEDKSGFANLKLLYLHFPDNVNIMDIDIEHIERNVVSTQTNELTEKVSHYFAFVYTSEKLDNQSIIYVRHYLYGSPKKYGMATGEGFFDRLDWQFDTKQEYCKRLNDPISAVSRLDVRDTNDGDTEVTIAEFYGTYHKKYLIFFPKNKPRQYRWGELSTIHEPNLDLLNCPKFFDPSNIVPADPNINQYEGKPFDPKRCMDSKMLGNAVVFASGLFDGQVLIFLAKVPFTLTDLERPQKRDEFLMFTSLYIDETHSADDDGTAAHFYETSVLTLLAPKWGRTFFDRQFTHVGEFSPTSQYAYFNAPSHPETLQFIPGEDDAIRVQTELDVFYAYLRNAYSKESPGFVRGFEFHYDYDTTNPLNIMAYNHKTVFEVNKETQDKSEFLNLQLFFKYFPQNVTILGIVMFKRDAIGVFPLTYYAFVYTKEFLPRLNTTIYYRHYMKGVSKRYTYHDYNYYRLDWDYYAESHYQCFNSFPGEIITTASKLYEYTTQNGSLVIKIIEFQGFGHRIIEVIFPNKTSDRFEIVNDKSLFLMDNRNIFSCRPRPNYTYKYIPPSDCRMNTKLNIDYQKENDFIVDDEPLYSFEEEADLFWHLIFICVLIIAILALIAYGVYLKFSEVDPTHDQMLK